MRRPSTSLQGAEADYRRVGLCCMGFYPQWLVWIAEFSIQHSSCGGSWTVLVRRQLGLASGWSRPCRGALRGSSLSTVPLCLQGSLRWRPSFCVQPTACAQPKCFSATCAGGLPICRGRAVWVGSAAPGLRRLALSSSAAVGAAVGLALGAGGVQGMPGLC
jgi:hypothetical protein